MHGGTRWLIGLGLAAAVAWAVGCGDSVAPEDLPGHYDLYTVNGDTPPVTVTSQGVDFTIEDGSWDLTASTFSGDLTVSVMSLEVTATFSGTYTVSGSTLTMTGTAIVEGNSEDFSGQLTANGRDLTLVDNSLGPTITAVFRKP